MMRPPSRPETVVPGGGGLLRCARTGHSGSPKGRPQQAGPTLLNKRFPDRWFDGLASSNLNLSALSANFLKHFRQVVQQAMQTICIASSSSVTTHVDLG